MTKTKNTKAFYNTEIPSDWEIRRLGDFVEKIVGGGTPSREKIEYWNGNIYWATVKDFTNFNSLQTQETITDVGLKNSASNVIPKGTVITATRMALGKAVKFDIDVAINQDLKAIFPKSNLDSDFLCYWFEHNLTTIEGLGNGSTVKGISLDELKNIKFYSVPLPEQKAIAKVLSAADAAIHTTEKLIAQKELRKKWLMQQLLTGKKRLKGFEGEWKKLGAGEIFKSITKNGFVNEELLSATQDRGMIPRTMLEGRVTMPTTGTEGFKLVEVGDFVISLRSFQGGLEYSYYRGLVSPAYTVLKPKKPINEEFYKQYFKSHDFIGHLAIAVIGIRDGKQISYDDFCTVKIPYPSIEEQTAIAQVLQAADKEISLLKAKAEKLREQKKGLMQVLLTGKVRLKINNT